MQVHATAIDIVIGKAPPSGVLLRGASGSGKSDLALRLIDAGARLVSDDRTDLVVQDGCLYASAPAALAGLLEVRGIGLFQLDPVKKTPVRLVVDLVPQEQVPRLPEKREEDIGGVYVPRVALYGFDASAPAKIRMALNAVQIPSLMTAGFLTQ